MSGTVPGCGRMRVAGGGVPEKERVRVTCSPIVARMHVKLRRSTCSKTEQTELMMWGLCLIVSLVL